MTSVKQIGANRRNARKSTGPRSEAGKAVSRNNAIKHGILSSVVVAEGEEKELFDALLGSLAQQFDPKTPTGVAACREDRCLVVARTTAGRQRERHDG